MNAGPEVPDEGECNCSNRKLFSFHSSCKPVMMRECILGTRKIYRGLFFVVDVVLWPFKRSLMGAALSF